VVSPKEMTENLKCKSKYSINPNNIQIKEKEKIQGVTNLPPLGSISSSRFGCSGNKYGYAVLKKSALSQVASSSV
jgi:hypothetical protein